MRTLTASEDGRTQSAAKTIRVLLADDHPIARIGLKTVLSGQQDLQIVGEAGDAQEVLAKIQELDPDVLLLDHRLNTGVTSPLASLQASNSRVRTVVMATAHDQNEFVEVMRQGASGILLKQSSPDLVVSCIHKVHDGEIWLDSQTTAAVVRRFSAGRDATPLAGAHGGRKPLSPREREIVALVAQGYKNREIAESIFLSEQTVKNHLHNIFDKLQVSDRLELALYAVHTGIYSSASALPKIPAKKSEDAPVNTQSRAAGHIG